MQPQDAPKSAHHHDWLRRQCRLNRQQLQKFDPEQSSPLVETCSTACGQAVKPDAAVQAR